MKSDLDVARARAADLLDVAHSHGAQLKKSSGEWIGPCPACGGSDRFSINIKNSRLELPRLRRRRRHRSGNAPRRLNFRRSRASSWRRRGHSGRREPTPERSPRGRRGRNSGSRKRRPKRRGTPGARQRSSPACSRSSARQAKTYLRDVRRIDVSHWAIRRALRTSRRSAGPSGPTSINPTPTSRSTNSTANGSARSSRS